MVNRVRISGVYTLLIFSAKVMAVMTTWPTKNHHTDITSVMCARSGHMTTVLWGHGKTGHAAPLESQLPALVV